MPEGLALAAEVADPETLELLAAHGSSGPRLLDYLRGQEVDIAVALPCGRQAVQEYTLDEAERSGGRLLPFVQYDPRAAPTARRRFAHAIDRGAVGLKVHPCNTQLPANDRSLYPLFALAEERRIPVMVHVGSSVFPGAKMRFCDPMLIDEVAADFPDLVLICAHSGRGFWTQQVFQLTRMRPNVWMELSGIPAKRIPEYFPELDRVGNRVLFGSDWPSSPAIAQLVRELKALPYDSELLANVLWRNAVRLFGIPTPCRDTTVHRTAPNRGTTA